jgi:tetratricopeptide (TPR) repeat protein
MPGVSCQLQLSNLALVRRLASERDVVSTMHSRGWIRNGHIPLLFLFAASLHVSPVLSQLKPMEQCSVAESEMRIGLLPSQPQALVDKTYSHALAQFKAGKLQPAAEELQPLDFASAKNALGVILQALGDRDGALEAFQQARKLWPDSDEVAYNLANLMIQVGRPNAAILQLQRSDSRYHGSGVMRLPLTLLLGEAYRIAGKDKLAVQTLEPLLPDNSNSAELRFKLALLYKSLRLFDASIEQYEEGLRLEPANCSALMELGKTLLQTDKASEAVPWLKEYVRLRPQDAEGYYVSGRALRDLGQFTQASAMFSTAVHLSADDYAMRYQFAMVQWKIGDHEVALREFESAERLKPDEVQVHSTLARVLSELGKKDQARDEEASAERLLSRQHDLERASFCIGTGNTLLKQGNLNDAEAQFRAALQFDPQSARARSNLGLVLALLHHPEDGQRELQKAIALDPQLAEAYNALGVSYAEEARASEAKSAFERAIQLAPEYAEAKNNLGALYAKSGKNAEAVALFAQATEDFPEYPQSYLNWGLVLASQGNLGSAKAMFEKALQLSPDIAQAREALQIANAVAKPQK